MLKDDYRNLLSIFSTLIVVIISSCINKKILQILFILIFIFTCYSIFSNLNNKKSWKQFLIAISCCIECIIIIYSIMDVGSISRFFWRMGDFFVHEESEITNLTMNNNESIDPYKDLSEQISKIQKNVEGMNSNITKIDENIHKLANDLGNPYINNTNEDEVDIILQQIEKEYNDYNYDEDFFLNLKTDPYLFEIFYKMFISEKPYYYCNIIKAFKEYGIDDEKISIDENDLLIWDIERLYTTYNMKNSIINELGTDEIIEEKIFYYNDFRASMNRYSDTFDYGNWKRYFEDKTASDIDNMLNTTIMNYYKKIIINFTME